MPDAESDVPRCAGCGYAEYGHYVAIERLVASGHEWEPRDPPPGVPMPDSKSETAVHAEREHRWFEYGRWFTGFGPSMDPHRCDEPGVICEWRERTVATTTTPWARTTKGES